MSLTLIILCSCVVLFVDSQITSCRTVDGNSGKCGPIKDCSALYTLSQKKKHHQTSSSDEIALLRRSACGLTPDGRPKVCCPVNSGTSIDSSKSLEPLTRISSPSTTSSPILTTLSQLEQFMLLSQDCPPTVSPPTEDCCGVDSSGGNRIIGGEETALDEHPWLALLEYHNRLQYPGRVESRIELSCAGSLISSRYVLTAAHCINPRLTNVRLAEYNTTSHPQDCVVTDGLGEDCSTVLVVPVSSSLVHPGYSPEDNDKADDIALIQLKNNAPYTDFIRPICLPSTDFTIDKDSSASLIVAGWGSDGASFSAVKRRVTVPHVPSDICRRRYESLKGGPRLTNKQVCAGQGGKDSCRGDSGGPLMTRSSSGLFQLVGVVSSGPRQCGHPRLPGIYTAVYPYRQWIRDHMTA